eukprot:6425485-Pyramimonas_sp.AAC.1
MAQRPPRGEGRNNHPDPDNWRSLNGPGDSFLGCVYETASLVGVLVRGGGDYLPSYEAPRPAWDGQAAPPRPHG